MEKTPEISPSDSPKEYEVKKEAAVSEKAVVAKRIEVKKDSNKKESKVNRKTTMDAVMGRIDGQEELQAVADSLTNIGEVLSKQLNCKFNTYTSGNGDLVLEFIDAKNKLIRSVNYNSTTNVFISEDKAVDDIDMQAHEHNVDMRIAKVDENGIQLTFDGGKGNRMEAVYNEKTHKVTVSSDMVDGKMKVLLKNYSFKGKTDKQVKDFILGKFVK